MFQAGTLKQAAMVPTNTGRGAQRSSPSTQCPGWVLLAVPLPGHLPRGQPCDHELGEVTSSCSTTLLPATAFWLVSDGTAQHSRPSQPPHSDVYSHLTVAEATGCPGQESPALREPRAALSCPNCSS